MISFNQSIMFLRQDRQRLEEEQLAPYAAKSGNSLGRFYSETEDPLRTIFQRDRDRIIHCKAFRRLEYKTQVFVNHEGDHYRTRLTHTLEVAQISRAIARALRLNEDLAEAIALAHDLGHTPFGHAGEKTLNNLMRDYGGFEHNTQSFRVVTKLEERYPDFPGLNLSKETLTGLLKHHSEYDNPKETEVSGLCPGLTLEAQIVNLADEIAYNNHDTDDGLRSGMLSLNDLSELKLWSDLRTKVDKARNSKNIDIIASLTIRSLINTLITDVIDETKTRIKQKSISSLRDVYELGQDLVGFSEKIVVWNRELKAYLSNNLYCHWRVNRMADKANRILSELFKAYVQNQSILRPDEAEKIFFVDKEFPMSNDERNPKNKENRLGKKYRIICDYLAGMTDRYALDEYKKLFDPHARV